MLSLYALVTATGFVFTALALWLLRWLAARLDLVDHPYGRKVHGAATPVVGGLAILLGWAGAMGVGLASHIDISRILSNTWMHKGFVLGAVLLVGVGVMDDRRPIAARYKLAVQLVACVLAVGLDNAIVGSSPIPFGHLVLTIPPGMIVPFTVLVMLTITNAINMIDGVDGLAAGISFVALLIMAKAVTTAGFSGAPMLLSVVGALAAFLIFNFPLSRKRPAKVFLGDAGSLLCGFTLAYMAIKLSAMPTRVFKPATAVWFVFIPVADTIWLYLRRTLYGRAPFAAGRDHIHHILLNYMSPKAVTWLLVGLSAALACAGYAAERKGAQSTVLIELWVLTFIFYGLLTQKAWKAAWLKSRAAQDAIDRAEDGGAI